MTNCHTYTKIYTYMNIKLHLWSISSPIRLPPIFHMISMGVSPRAVHWTCACSPFCTCICFIFWGKYAGAEKYGQHNSHTIIHPSFILIYKFLFFNIFTQERSIHTSFNVEHNLRSLCYLYTNCDLLNNFDQWRPICFTWQLIYKALNAWAESQLMTVKVIFCIQNLILTW